MTLRHRIKFYQQLASLARGGVPMRTSLQKMAGKSPSHEVRVLARQLEEGNTLGEAFVAARFSPFECHLVGAGERSAQLEVAFERLGEFWNRERRFGQALVRQLYYPALVLHLAVVVGGLLLLSQGTSAVIASIIWNLGTLYFVAIMLYLLIRASWSSPLAKRFWLAVPVIGGALKAANAYRWITALRMEFTAGVSFPEAVADAWRASGYVGAEARAQEGASEMRSGTELSSLVQRWRQLPRDWPEFFETAEMSGEFEKTFTYIETEAAHAWAMNQERMTEWVPKFLTIAFILLMALKIVPMANQAINGPVIQAENAINDAGR
jgi:general secretion pathway protein F